MEKNHLNRYKLEPAVFYRRYKDSVTVYHTGFQKVYSFSESAGEILDCFKDYSDINDVVNSLLDIYDVKDSQEFRQTIEVFTGELAEKGIIKAERCQQVKDDSLEKEVTGCFKEGEQLYSVTIELTYKCNEKCRHCYIAGEDRKELSTEQIKSLLDDLEKMNVFNIVFTGGEVFTRKDAFEILEYAYSKNFLIDIFTNGTLLDGNDYIRLKAIWPRSVHFSLYSSVPEKHDAVTRIKGSFEKTLKSIKACSLIGIPVNIKTPIFSETVNDIEELVNLATCLDVSIELGNNITPRKNGDLSPIEMSVQDESAAIALSEKMTHLIEFIPSDNITNQTENVKLCGAGDRSVSIDPYGRVFPCNMLQICIGDINEQGIDEIWKYSDSLKKWRVQNKRCLRKGCEDCYLSDECIFCPGEAMMRTGSPLGKYQEACQATKRALEIRR